MMIVSFFFQCYALCWMFFQSFIYRFQPITSWNQKYSTYSLLRKIWILDKHHIFERDLKHLLLFFRNKFFVLRFIDYDLALIADLALSTLKYEWKNVPPSWEDSEDPCGDHWEGIECSNSRVITMYFFS